MSITICFSHRKSNQRPRRASFMVESTIIRSFKMYNCDWLQCTCRNERKMDNKIEVSIYCCEYKRNRDKI